jgi:acyl carrier protein
MTRDEIFGKIVEVLEDALGVDEDEVTPTAVLTKELGAESIDFLDITFKLEQAFDFKIPQGDLFPDGAAQDPDYVVDGKITTKGIEEMKSKMPHVDFSEFEKNPNVGDVQNIFTVNVLVNYVERKLAAPAT